MIEVDASACTPLGMPAERFLREYWQRRPLLIRRAFPDFTCPLTPEDLAGLACEDFALARLVQHDPASDRWTLRNGPFDESDFATLPPSHWTLLVQDVDKWDADVAALLGHFTFLPSWRVDDIMVSYAEDGGSVGAHVDQYDVFLLQGLGRRRWSICTDPDAPDDFRDDVELKLLREFRPDHEWLLEPGDMLYLPPGIAHHGVAEGPCLTLSVGMRAPAIGELVADLAASIAERLGEELRYTDAGMAPARTAGEIDAAALQRVEAALRDSLAVDASTLRCWFGSFMTRYRAVNEAIPRPKALTVASFERQLAGGAELHRNPWSRMAWIAHESDALLFVAGNELRCSQALAERLCTRAPLAGAEVLGMDDAARALLLTLVNQGHLALHKPGKRP